MRHNKGKLVTKHGWDWPNFEQAMQGGCIECGSRSNILDGYKTNLCSLCVGKVTFDERMILKWVTLTGPSDLRTKNEMYKKYGLTVTKYAMMTELQQGKCYICKKVWDKDLYVDHDHRTGKTRKLLCNTCNSCLGNADDSIERLVKMVEYLQEHQ